MADIADHLGAAIAGHLEAIRHLRELAEGTDELIVCLASAEDGALRWVSPRGLRALLGREVDDVLGKPSLAVLAGLTRGSRPEQDRARMVAGETVAATYDAQRADGSTIPLRVTGWRLDDDVVVGLAVRAGP